MTDMTPETSHLSWLDQPIQKWLNSFDLEKIIFTVILILAVFSRFYMLGERVMSHDEVNHVRPSWELFQGQGYRHDPVTHGPMQFHLISLSYTLFGDNDLTSRLPSALFSIATIWMVWKYRRYLGRVGALLSALMMLISPYMLFYGRYTRNESFVALFGVITLYLILRYLEEPRSKYLYGLAAVFALQFITKETSFIYSAQALLFLGILFVKRIQAMEWKDPTKKRTYLIGIIMGLFFAVCAIGVSILITEMAAQTAASLGEIQGEGLIPTQAASSVPSPIKVLPIIFAGFSLAGIIIAGIYLLLGVGLSTIREERSFDLLILVGTLVLPQLTAFPVKLLGWNPLDYSDVGMLRTGILLAIIMAISALIGLWWNRNIWWKAALLFYAIYVFFYTTIFTNGQGFFTGIIGSLGYWLEQQGVNRGSQPWYFYAGIQIPIYEFLPAIGAILAILFSSIRWLKPNREEIQSAYTLSNDFPGDKSPLTINEQLPVWLLIFWSVSALVAYTVAGEKMPWLTVHIAWPMILLAGWSYSRVVTKIPFRLISTKFGWISLAATILLVIGLGRAIFALNSVPLPFSGNELDQLSTTSNFILTILCVIGSSAVLYYVSKQKPGFSSGSIFGVIILVGLAILTFRASFRANYINYDSAKEYLVYAHAARGPKDILKQVEEISQRLTGGKTLRVGYDNSSLYPYWWYFRDYTNTDYFAEKPSKAVRDDAIILVGNPNYSKIEPLVGNGYYSFEYERLWWPNQDYFNVTLERLRNAITDPNIREGIFQIWLNRDYKKYAEATGNLNLTPETWEPAERIKMYIKKDLAAQIWNYGLIPTPEVVAVDPYEAGRIPFNPDITFGSAGDLPGQFNAPRGMSVAPDGSIYVADSRNNRIQHFSSTGEFINGWGSFADIAKGAAPGGTFNEPWGVAVAGDGSIYVTDTWNHRIQKFNSNGEFITMWGVFGQGETPDAFWGPRGIAVDEKNKVYITDTGNKRVVIFNQDGTLITSFGTYGLEPGQFDEPVGIGVDQAGVIYVADTWNQRIQAFTPDQTGTTYEPTNQWEVSGWNGQSLENKPFLSVSSNGNIFISDPEMFRIIQFTQTGEFVRTWGEYSTESDGFGLPSGLAADSSGGIWVTDATNNRVMHFVLP